MGKLRVGVLVSGRGSNLQALLDAAADPAYPAELAVVVANVAGVEGLARAERAGVPSRVVDHRAYDGRAAFEAALDLELVAAGVEFVCLAGFMRLLTAEFVERWRDRLINIHPSLLPAFRGLHTHERVLAAGCRFTGCTVHVVRAEMDEGPILVQAVVPVRPDDDADSLAARVLAEEHLIYPLALRLVAEGRVRIDGARAVVAGAHAPRTALINPAPDSASDR